MLYLADLLIIAIPRLTDSSELKQTQPVLPLMMHQSCCPVGEDGSSRPSLSGYAKKERTPEEQQGLWELIDKIRQDGEFGMVKIVSRLKQTAGESGKLGTPSC